MQQNTKELKILIRLPNWLGDAVMSTPMLELLKSHFSKARFCLVAPKSVLEIFKGDSHIDMFISDESKKAKCRIYATYALTRCIKTEFGVPDIAMTLTNHFFSALLLRLTNARIRVGYKRVFGCLLLTKSVPKLRNAHQVLSYVNLATYALDSKLASKLSNARGNIVALESISPNLKLHLPNKKIPNELSTVINDKTHKIIGLNPAAAYGNAKRWLPKYFAQITSYFANRGEAVVIFGTKNDYKLGEYIKAQALDFAQNTAKAQNLNQNILNLCGETDIAGLMSAISEMNLFITNDSGPMHIACALQTPTIALFGPTKSDETNGFRARHFVLLKENVPCAPCKKRECPLPKGEGHHKCMVDLLPSRVIKEADNILDS